MRDFLWRLQAAFSFIARDLAKDRLRTIVTLLNLIVFLSCYFCLAALARAANDFGKQDKQGDTLLVMSKNTLNPSDSSISAAELNMIRKAYPTQIASVSPLIYKLLRIDDYLIQVCGAKPEDFTSVFGLTLTTGSWPSRQNEVVIGEGAASLAKWKIDQTLNIYGTPFVISGIVSAPGTKASSVWMDLNEAETLFSSSDIYQFAWIIPSSGINSDALRKDLQDLPAIGEKFDVLFVDALYQQYSKALQGIKDISLVLVGFALLMVLVGTYGSIYLTLTERRRELAIIRALGFSALAIRLILVLRSSFEIVIAFILTLGISELLLKWFNTISPLTINSLPLNVSINSLIFTLGAVLSILCGIVGVWLPTMRLRFSTVRESIQR